MTYFRISTETGKMSDAEKLAFLGALKELKQEGTKGAYIKICRSLPSPDKITAFFFVLCQYFTAQNMETMKYTKDDFEIYRQQLMKEFLPKRPARNIVIKKDGKMMEREANIRQSLTNSTTQEKKEMVEKVITWMASNGYEVPSSESYHDKQEENLKVCGGDNSKAEKMTKDYFKSNLETIIKSKYG